MFQILLLAPFQKHPAQRRKNLLGGSRAALPHQRKSLIQRLQTPIGTMCSRLPENAEQDYFKFLFPVEQRNDQFRYPRVTAVQKRRAASGDFFHQKNIVIADTAFQADLVLFHRTAEGAAVQGVFRRKSACVAPDSDALPEKIQVTEFCAFREYFFRFFHLSEILFLCILSY